MISDRIELAKWKTSEVLPYFFGFGVAVFLETVCVHFLARIWLNPQYSLMVAAGHFLLGLVLLYWLFLLPARVPNFITSEALILNYGNQARVSIALDCITSMEATKMVCSSEFGGMVLDKDKKTEVMFMTMGKSNKILVKLKEPIRVKGLRDYGYAGSFVFNLDNPALLQGLMNTTEDSLQSFTDKEPPWLNLNDKSLLNLEEKPNVMPEQSTATSSFAQKPSLSLKKIGKSFGEIAALKDLNIDFYPGELFGLLGPNGAGKTTTLKLIAGLLQPSEGRLTNNLENIAYMPEYLTLYDRLSGREFLEFLGILYDADPFTLRKKIDRYLKRFDLHKAADRPIGSYSQGMKRKVSLIGTIIKDGSILLLDEPTNGLDPAGILQVKELLRELAGEGKTVVVSTHILEMAEKLCDRVGVIAGGTLLFVGTLEELREKTRMNEASLEEIFMRLIQMERGNECYEKSVATLPA